MPATLLLTDQLADEFERAVESGVPIETAAQAAGVSPRQFYEWLRAAESGSWSTGTPVESSTFRTISAFSQRIRAAQARFEAKQVAGVAAAAEAVGKNGIPEWRARAWLLNNHPRYRERYRQHRETTVNGEVHHLHEISLAKQLEHDQLDAAYTMLDALPQPDQ